MDQKARFIEWMKLQPRPDAPQKKYAPGTVKAAADKLESGCNGLRVPGYETVNCFAVTDATAFQAIYDACYDAATAADLAQGTRDFRNGLDYYLQFLQYPEKLRKNIRTILTYYKENFHQISPKEQYKWEAVQWYKQHWNIDAPDFAHMVEQAFAKAGNLLASANVYSYKMLVQFAQKDPEAARSCFRALYDESTPLEQRVQAFLDFFKEKEKEYRESSPDHGKAFSYSQDRHAITVYLSFEYPETYFIYKAEVVDKFAARVGFSRDTSYKQLLPSFTELCRYVLEELSLDTELLELHRARLDSRCYPDPSLHLLATDVIFYGGAYMEDAPTSTYEPNLTKEDWKEYILKVELPDHPKPMQMLKAMLNEGGATSCRHLAETYGGTYNRYIGCVVNLGKRVKKHFDLPPYIVNGAECFYAIPFLGEYVSGEDAFIYQIRPELMAALEEIDLSNVALYAEEKDMTKKTDIALNTILYGPPGTGKTYHTAYYAVAIIKNIPLKEAKLLPRETVLALYNNYKAQGLIEFTTFHQSYGYEEFIEGIRPVVVDDDGLAESGDIQYSVQPGIFKKFCKKADHQITVSAHTENLGIREEATVWKVSLFGTGDNEVRTECLENGHIRIGWDQYGKDITDETEFNQNGGRVVLNAFINKMQVGDIVFSCYSASTIDAIGVITGEYEWHDEYNELKRVRKVNWIVKGIRENILAINGGTTMTLASVYRLTNIALSDVYKLIEKHQPAQTFAPSHQENYVFIIDEINRGNVSKIFGELITLIEDNKRLGRKDSTQATLPYSQTPFGIPENVYILGTMNTADRSISALDTALRRRFEFEEMLPQPAEVLKDITVEGIDIPQLLTTINKRIEALYDREHTIGHAYFTDLKQDNSMDALAKIFQNKVIPLLQEYFYEDYDKIRLVLGDHRKDEQYQFVKKNTRSAFDLFGVHDLELQDSYTINTDAFRKPEAYQI